MIFSVQSARGWEEINLSKLSPGDRGPYVRYSSQKEDSSVRIVRVVSRFSNSIGYSGYLTVLK